LIFHPLFDPSNLKHVVDDIKILQKVGEERTYLKILCKNFNCSETMIRNSVIRLENFGLLTRNKVARTNWIDVTEDGVRLIEQIRGECN
jgi:DNA-binding transcriptional regulator PaaX